MEVENLCSLEAREAGVGSFRLPFSLSPLAGQVREIKKLQLLARP